MRRQLFFECWREGEKQKASLKRQNSKTTEGKTTEGKATEGKTTEGKTTEGKTTEGKMMLGSKNEAAMAMMLTIEDLRNRLDYVPATGRFAWKFNPQRTVQWNGRYAGKDASYLNALGYVSIRMKVGDQKVLFQAHRLAFFWMLGKWPEHEIDHVNGDRSDNRWENLREATRAQNAANTSHHQDSKSGVKGVHFCRLRRKWKAGIMAEGRRISCGYHVTKDEAIKARHEAERLFQGKFARAA
jgi:hypothetical protein